MISIIPYNEYIPYPEYLGPIISVILIIIFAFILTNFFVFIINKLSNKWSLEITFNYLLKDLSRYIIIIIALFTILEVVGVDVSAIVLSLGIIGVSFGFAARDIISSFLAGIFILLDNTVRVGEVIEVATVKGRVKKLGFRTTTLITPDNLIVTIPNSVLSNTAYISYTFFDEQRIDLEVSIPNSIDLEVFKTIFIKEVIVLDWVLKDPKPRVIVQEIMSGEIVLKISAWADEYYKIEDYRLNLANEVRKIINEMS
jgi:small conductance mechanosensitive channel